MTAVRSRKTKPSSSSSRKRKTAVVAKPSNLNQAETAEIKKIFTRHIPKKDQRLLTPQDIQAITENFLDFARERKPGQIKIRVFNPTQKNDGYTSKHTVIMVANDDMPFLVDSSVGEILRMEIDVHMIVHPIVKVRRDAQGVFQGFETAVSKGEAAHTESWMYIEIDETAETKKLQTIAENIEYVLHHVRMAVSDWREMRAKVLETITELPRNADVGLPAGAREETADFLAWLEADHFTFLGMRDYRVVGKGKDTHLETIKPRSLGVLREATSVMFFSEEGESNQPDIHQFLERKELVLITKTHRASVVHRTSLMDAILIKRFDEKGNLVGERLFVGLFTSSAYSRPAKDVPLIRGKIDYVLDKANLDPRSHNGKALSHTLNAYPRDELFQISAADLYETTIGIVQLHERQRLALFIRPDEFGRFVNCLIFVPRERYDTKLRRHFQRILLQAFSGVAADYQVNITTDMMAQIFIVVRTSGGVIPPYDREDLEHHLQEASRGWAGQLKNELITVFGENQGLKLAQKYAEGFPDTYCDSVRAQEALKDIAFIEKVLRDGKLRVSLHRPAGAESARVNLKWYNAKHELSLSQILPAMKCMGLETDAENGPYQVLPREAATGVWVHDCLARMRAGLKADIEAVKEKFEECLIRAWNGEVEADDYNQLVLLADLNWREVVILRSIGKYLRQAAMPYSEEAIVRALTSHPQAAQLLVKLFITRHDPALSKERDKEMARLEKALRDYYANVSLLEQDIILRRFLNVITNTLRTNYFQKDADGNFKPYLSFKLNSRQLDDLPLPRPYAEIFVYSPRVEAIHLRGGKVARGGIRWSDRREDFRTEVLSLMKAQQVKNTVIVPVGSKGGFVVKTPNPPDMGEEGIACYQTMMRGLLDLTDNHVGGKIAHPKQVVRHDDDDPYLVVAADKGTAKFSDIANAISLERGFWLGDAFASGGSAGYDHKEMGITAKGAWEAIKRHFREIGKNIQKQDFTVVGVGDMSGDVFGNGMLLSPRIKLLAAFNHKHIFIDPSPDIKASFEERQRLFDLPRSQWSDYDKKAISKGGGIYGRDVKSIKLSREARDVFNIAQEEIAPDKLIQALLKSRVELLWFGGIGTYIKGAEENNLDAGDRSNDGVRVNAEEIRALVIGEGANLGMTQRARIAYAAKGGRLNTDAIDNSAGVDTSDHEVNIKILLDPIVQAKKLTLKERNQLLVRMTQEVATLVLRDNYAQTLTLSVAQRRAAEMLPVHARLMHNLERKGLLNRRVEFLPDDDEIQERLGHGRGLTRPELAVLMAYAKIDLYDSILASPLPDNPGLAYELQFYFPKPLQEKYGDEIRQHRLQREIIAAFTTNSVINRGGPHITQLLQEKTGKSSAEIAGAFAVFRDVFNLRQLWTEIEALDDKVASDVTNELHVRIGKSIERTTPWYAQRADLKDTATLIEKHRVAVQAISRWMESGHGVFPERDKDKRRFQELLNAGVPEKLVRYVLTLPALTHVPEIAEIAEHSGRKLEDVAEFYFALEARFQLFWLRNQARELVSTSHWQREALDNLIEDLYRVQTKLTQMMLSECAKTKSTKKSTEQIEAWVATRGGLSAYDSLITQISNTKPLDFAMLSLGLRQLQQWMASRG